MTMRRGLDIVDTEPELRLPSRPQLSLGGELSAPLGLRPRPLPRSYPDAAQLHIHVPAGLVAPTRYRLRRGGEGPEGAEAMRVVVEGELPPPGSDGIRATARDPGPLPLWRLLRWVVEVQGAGVWSLPSLPVSYAMIPPIAPAAPTRVSGVRHGRAVTVTITHPDGAALGETPMGSFRFEVYRAVEGRPELLSVPVLCADETTFTFLDAPPSFGTAVYAARVLDPLGRASAFALSSAV